MHQKLKNTLKEKESFCLSKESNISCSLRDPDQSDSQSSILFPISQYGDIVV